ncbi:MAG: ribonuclease HII [Candidatus Neomarinimicrobiota bacterium]
MKIIAGVDEVGRGPLAGPVYAAAVILSKNHTLIGLDDSKKISKKKRELLFLDIRKQAISIGLGYADVKTIDKINIREASFIAMEMALKNLSKTPDYALIDGFPLKSQNIPNEGVIKGDTIHDNIKAASIIAKVIRDNLMSKYNLIFPEYNFLKNNGYGTKEHIEALEKHKATPIHRKTFRKVSENIPTFNWLIEKNKLKWMGNKFAGLLILEEDKNIKKKIIKADMDEGFFIVVENKEYVFVFVYTKYKNMGFLFNPKKGVSLKDIKDSRKIMIERIINEQNNFRFDIINVTLEKGNPIIKHIKNVNITL